MPGEVRCQVRGCANDVSGTVLKRYRVCEEHLREPEVLIDGQPQRFCRQCRKFHLLNRFEGNNRNCLEKLLKHNHRRRVKRQQRKEVSEDDPQCFSSLMETFEESASDGDQSISPSLQLEFNRLRKLQRRYNPVSSSSLDNTASTAMYMADGMNAENSYRERPMDGQSETNSPNNCGCARMISRHRSPSNLNSTASTSFEAETDTQGNGAGDEGFSCFNLLDQGPSEWHPTLLNHADLHICAGEGCFVCIAACARSEPRSKAMRFA
mmetsp:Transcript_6469/g.16754  ORF Transcript_6469/g.16754 Transcript_6469/m.16754 type:complete len:266 (-) Transcript_6469:219-1016(-)